MLTVSKPKYKRELLSCSGNTVFLLGDTLEFVYQGSRPTELFSIAGYKSFYYPATGRLVGYHVDGTAILVALVNSLYTLVQTTLVEYSLCKGAEYAGSKLLSILYDTGDSFSIESFTPGIYKRLTFLEGSTETDHTRILCHIKDHALGLIDYDIILNEQGVYGQTPWQDSLPPNSLKNGMKIYSTKPMPLPINSSFKSCCSLGFIISAQSLFYIQSEIHNITSVWNEELEYWQTTDNNSFSLIELTAFSDVVEIKELVYPESYYKNTFFLEIETLTLFYKVRIIIDLELSYPNFTVIETSTTAFSIPAAAIYELVSPVSVYSLLSFSFTFSDPFSYAEPEDYLSNNGSWGSRYVTLHNETLSIIPGPTGVFSLSYDASDQPMQQTLFSGQNTIDTFYHTLFENTFFALDYANKLFYSFTNSSTGFTATGSGSLDLTVRGVTSLIAISSTELLSVCGNGVTLIEVVGNTATEQDYKEFTQPNVYIASNAYNSSIFLGKVGSTTIRVEVIDSSITFTDVPSFQFLSLNNLVQTKDFLMGAAASSILCYKKTDFSTFKLTAQVCRPVSVENNILLFASGRLAVYFLEERRTISFDYIMYCNSTYVSKVAHSLTFFIKSQVEGKFAAILDVLSYDPPNLSLPEYSTESTRKSKIYYSKWSKELSLSNPQEVEYSTFFKSKSVPNLEFYFDKDVKVYCNTENRITAVFEDGTYLRLT